MNERVTIKVDIEKYDEIKKYYYDFITDFDIAEYTDYRAYKDDIEIVGYLSESDKRKVTFNGEGAKEEAKKWSEDIKVFEEKKAVAPKGWLCFANQIGSDEVGVGDFLLPMIVVSSYVKSSQIKEINALGIKDSKKLSDDTILEIVPQILEKFEFSKLTLTNEKYNEMIAKGENINSLKAKMHNRALANLLKKHSKVENIFIDQFVNEDKYYSYLDEKADKPIVRNVTFMTKGESYYPCVALASMVARYYLIKEKRELEAKYGFSFLMGASKTVDKKAKLLLDELGKDEFDKLVKKNFKNYERILEEDL